MNSSKVLTKVNTWTTGGKTTFTFMEDNSYTYVSEHSSGICDWRWHDGEFQGKVRTPDSTWFTLNIDLSNKLEQAVNEHLYNILEA